MKQWLIRKLISLMGNVYVWLDKMLEHPKGDILNVSIDDDLQNMTRRELCNHVENKFGWKKDSFWFLESTQKIRLCCQVSRNFMKEQSKK
jgi:hypothetical protein